MDQHIYYYPQKQLKECFTSFQPSLCNCVNRLGGYMMFCSLFRSTAPLCLIYLLVVIDFGVLTVLANSSALHNI